MKQERARRIMELLGWGPSETARRYNAVSGARYNRQQVHKQVGGARDVSDALAVFLRLSLRVARLERRLARQRAGSVGTAAVEEAAVAMLRAAQSFPTLDPAEVARAIVKAARAGSTGGAG